MTEIKQELICNFKNMKAQALQNWWSVEGKSRFKSLKTNQLHICKNTVYISQRTQCDFIGKTNQLMLCRETVAVVMT